MKLTALSDVHGTGMSLFDPHGADLCIMAGDLAPLHYMTAWDKQNQERWIRDELCGFISGHAKTEFCFVAGNHDFWGEKFDGTESWWPKNAHYLKNSSVELFGGMVIWGSPNVPYIGTARRWAFECSSIELKRSFSTMPKGADIAITHTPPRFGVCMIDVPFQAIDIMNKRPLHLGSSELTDIVKNKQPKKLFCGHIHTGNHEPVKIGCTTCRNVSLLDESYNASFYPFTEILKSKRGKNGHVTKQEQ